MKTAITASSGSTVARHHLTAGLYLVGVVNGLTGTAARSVAADGWLGAAYNLFGINFVVLFASLIGLQLALRAKPAPVRGGDLLAAGLFALLVLVPEGRISWAAIGLLALYSLGRDRACVFTAAAASVFLAISVNEVWGKVFLHILAEPLLQLDAALVSGILSLGREGVGRSGNLIDTGDGYTLAVMVGCSSFQNIALGLLCWVAITRAARPVWRRSDLAIGATVVGSILVLNVSRMVLMGVDLSYYERLHAGTGATVFNMIVLSVAIAVSAYGIRDELRAADSDR